MPTADAMAAVFGGSWAGKLLVVAGIAGILTSWNAFVIGGSRVLYALAESRMVPAVFARLHPRFHTPYVGIIAIGASGEPVGSVDDEPTCMHTTVPVSAHAANIA